MATNKFFKSLLFALMIAINLFSVCIEDSSAYPVFAQQNYSNPRAANGKLACANCHLNQKAIEIEAIMKANKRLLKNLLVAMD